LSGAAKVQFSFCFDSIFLKMQVKQDIEAVIAAAFVCSIKFKAEKHENSEKKTCFFS
jgi:hypothetical protein